MQVNYLVIPNLHPETALEIHDHDKITNLSKTKKRIHLLAKQGKKKIGKTIGTN